jgi:hypothetical protein
LFRLGILAAATELFLLEHYGTVWQQVPLWLLGVALLTSFTPVGDGKARAARALGIVCVLMVLSGVVGLLLHYQNNVAFEREMQPTIAGLALFWAAIRGAVPALAPGTMIYLGALGLLFIGIAQQRHAVVDRHAERKST